MHWINHTISIVFFHFVEFNFAFGCFTWFHLLICSYTRFEHIKELAKLRAEYYNEKNVSVNDEENLPSNLTIPGTPSNRSSRHSTISPPPTALYSSTTIAVPTLQATSEDSISKGWSSLPGQCVMLLKIYLLKIYYLKNFFVCFFCCHLI